MFTLRPSRQQMYADDPKYLWKPILRALAIILAITSIGLLGWSLTHQVVFQTNIPYNLDTADDDWLYSNDVWYLICSFITLGLSTLWNFANILTLLLLNRPLHPGANVACDLLLWLFLNVTSIFALVGAEKSLYWYPPDTTSSSSFITSPNGTVIAVSPQQSYPNAITRHGAGASFLVLLMHFALFVSACRATNARRVNALAGTIAEEMCKGRDGGRDAGGERNPNAAFVPIGELVEQQAPLGYGMPPAVTGVVGGKKGVGRAGGEEEGGWEARGSCERFEVMGEGCSGGRGVRACGDEFCEV